MYKVKKGSKNEDGYVVEIPFCGLASISIPESEIYEGNDEKEVLKETAFDIIANYSLDELGKDDRSLLVDYAWLPSIVNGNYFNGPRNDWGFYEEEVPQYEKVDYEKCNLEKVSMSVVNMSYFAKALVLFNCQLLKSNYWKEGKKQYMDATLLILSENIPNFEKLTGFTLIT